MSKIWSYIKKKVLRIQSDKKQGCKIVENQTNQSQGKNQVQNVSMRGEEERGGEQHSEFAGQKENRGDDRPLQCLDDYKGLNAASSQFSVGTSSNAESFEEGSNRSEKNSSTISDAKFNKIDVDKDVQPPLKDAEIIGRGGYANVYKSFYGNIPIAIKVFHNQIALNNQQRDDFKYELSIISKLDHKNIVKFYGASLQPGNRALVMEYVEYDLLQMIQKQKKKNERYNTNIKFPVKKIFKIIQVIASGLEYLHSKKVVHRDLHPSNVLISQDGCVKVADMGISKILQCSTAANTTQSGVFRYLAPEIFKNKINCKSDIYSLAIIAWELWSLDEAWKNFGEGFVVLEISNGARPQISHDMPKNLRDLIINCWQQDYKKRPSARDVVKECEAKLQILG